MTEEYSRKYLDGTDISKILLLLGYEWNDQARRYCSTDYGIPILTEKEGYRLAQRILGLQVCSFGRRSLGSNNDEKLENLKLE